MRVTRTAAVLTAALTAAALGGGTAVAGEQIDYVALGDSSAAGPLIPNQVDLACTRSDRNWPRAVAARLGADLTDVTSCASLLRDPLRPSCTERYTRGGTDRLAERTAALAPAIGAALEEIHRRSPDADVVVVGCLTYWQPGGCSPRDPIPPVDADYLQGTFDGLMDMLAEQADAHDATYVDIRTPSADHGLCAPIGEKWLEGLVPTAPTFPYHPNATGMAEAGAIIGDAIDGRDALT